jgi:hypothetical protein
MEADVLDVAVPGEEVDVDINDVETNEAEVTDQVETDVDKIEGEESSDTETTEKFSGRQITEAVKNAISQNPDSAKLFNQLKEAYFHNQAFTKAFPTAAEASSVAQLIQDVGGVEGIASIQERITQFDAQDSLLREGNPEVLDAMFKDFPEGAAALAPAYLDKLSQINPEQFQSIIAPYTVVALMKNNFHEFIAGMANETDPEKLQAYAKKGYEWFTKQYNDAKNSPYVTGAKANTGDSKLDQREAALNKRENDTFNNSITEKSKSITTPVINSETAKYAKIYKLSETQKSHFQAELHKAVAEDMKADKTYLKQAEIRYNSRTRTPETIANYVASEYNRRTKDLALQVASNIWGKAKSSSTQVTNVPRAEAPKTSSTGGPLQIKYKPSDEDINWNVPGAQMDFILQKATLRNGKKVSWKGI